MNLPLCLKVGDQFRGSTLPPHQVRPRLHWKPYPIRRLLIKTDRPMTAEEFWKQRASNLEMRKAEKLSGNSNRYRVTLRKYPSESRVDDMRPHRVVSLQQPAHAIAEPIKSEIIRSPRGQPITQTVYTEDGQRVSVDINLKLVSPPPVGGPTAGGYNSYHQGRPPPPMQQQRHPHPQQQHGGNSYHHQQRTPPHNTYGGYGGQSNQFTYRTPPHHQAHQPPPHNGRHVWDQVRLLSVSSTARIWEDFVVVKKLILRIVGRIMFGIFIGVRSAYRF